VNGGPDLVHLRAEGASLLFDCSAARLPRVLHWGANLGELADDELADLVRVSQPQIVTNTLDEVVPISIVPELSAGWLGTPGIAGHRDGADFSTSFRVTEVDVAVGPEDGPIAQSLVVAATDLTAGLALRLEVELTRSGLVRQRAALTSTVAGSFTLDGLLLTLPVPAEATQLLDLTGRHLRERSPQRHDFTLGTHVRESRRGRTGTDASLVLAAGTPGFAFRAGEVWAMHVAWSGNHRLVAERTPAGSSLLAGGELLLPGEVRLAQGETYSSPWIYGSYGHGLDDVTSRFHRYLRARPHHPRAPRPVTLNTWEAVYFDQTLDRLTALAEAAADVGAERFVLDDGWFRHRRSDNAGLGDWYVDETVWPDGLHPLVDTVRKVGLQFGLWVEPEMVNPDSDLARRHPEWIMATAKRLPPASRQQQVLDLAHPAAYGYILERLDSLVSEYEIDYLKWDHNRDLVEAGRTPHGAAGIHEQTRAVYRLLDELRSRHPSLEIESCSSGGGRVDLGILERTDRIWASDCIDALERQQIQRWTALIVPPEMMGAHVGSPIAHTTGRQHPLALRAGTALFGHFGIEWDLTTATAAERSELARWIRLYKDVRHLVHAGDMVRVDTADPQVLVHGVVAADRSRAIFAIVQLATSVQSPAGRIRLCGLDLDGAYRLTPLPPGHVLDGPAVSPLPWWGMQPVLSGRILADVGIQAPTLHPERLVLLDVQRVTRELT
jgi:alpha-galactosidase